MPHSASSGSPRTKPTTRSSIRQSLGKAFADVINKDGKDSDKASKKSKDTRRLSAINLKSAAPRNSMGEVKPPPQPVKRTGTPDSNTLTRKRLSATIQRYSSDQQPLKVNDTVPCNVPASRASTLRPSTRLNTVSTLPKYRPKSVASDVVKRAQSPTLTTTRRRLRTSEDEKEDKQGLKDPDAVQSPLEKAARSISPLPHRATHKKSDVASPTPPSTPSRRKSGTPSSNKGSPSRPTKVVKTAASSTVTQTHVARPSSSSSSSCSVTPHTPKPGAVRNSTRPAEYRRASPRLSARSSPQSSLESPSAHQQRRVYDLTNDSPLIGNMSHISEATSEEEDVALLLAPVADPTAPTPAMPRLLKVRNDNGPPPKTPTRAGNMLPSRAQMSYLSPLPPPTESLSSLRPLGQKPSGGDRIPRGSILSWEQLASEASKTLGEDEVHSMLADIPAPFGPGPLTPSISFGGIDIPESPCLSALNSPGGYGSISQVLLPDVTPSPAIHNGVHRYDMSGELTTVDGAIVTLLRLQLVAAENTAKERLTMLQMMEQEIHSLKEEYTHRSSELAMQVVQMNEQLVEKEESEERMFVERAAYMSSLEEQLRETQVLREQAIEEAIKYAKEQEQASREAAIKSRHVATEMTCAARVAHNVWDSVRDLSEVELETVRGDRELLSVLLAELDRMALVVQ
ncbi:hypothetical protein AX17_000134 [Amanita inopinata Kibby_2008]|nr:hypothetical protein AX17_000134 [Amanita inopinata Kibby_2008]